MSFKIQLLIFLLGVFFFESFSQNSSRHIVDFEHFTDTSNSINLEMIAVEGQNYIMGDRNNDFYNNAPLHNVTVSDFYIGKYEVTLKQWQIIMGTNPLKNNLYCGDNSPVSQISFEEITVFIEKLNRITGKEYRLPTEAEWEYAAKGGNRSHGYVFSGSDTLDNVAWNYGNTQFVIREVGRLQPNELGIYDMSGSACEWCSDWYHPAYYSQSPMVDPQGHESGLYSKYKDVHSRGYRVVRGGNLEEGSVECSVERRVCDDPTYPIFGVGFRLALSRNKVPENKKAKSDSINLYFTSNMNCVFSIDNNSKYSLNVYDTVLLKVKEIGHYVVKAESYYTGPMGNIYFYLNSREDQVIHIPLKPHYVQTVFSTEFKCILQINGHAEERMWLNPGHREFIELPVGNYTFSASILSQSYPGKIEYKWSAQMQLNRSCSPKIIFVDTLHLQNEIPVQISTVMPESTLHEDVSRWGNRRQIYVEPTVCCSKAYLPDIKMVRIAGGTYQMGCENEESAKPLHQEIVADFLIGKYEVTQAQWTAVMGVNPSSFSYDCDNCPVENVSWDDVQLFIKRLNCLSGKIYRLPTEAEWEFAAKGGRNMNNYIYSGSNEIDNIAWTIENSGYRTHPVGQKKANELGLYDMSGNVAEWCSDIYNFDDEVNAQQLDQINNSTLFVFRGGAWRFDEQISRVATRRYWPKNRSNTTMGFRLARDK